MLSFDRSRYTARYTSLLPVSSDRDDGSVKCAAYLDTGRNRARMNYLVVADINADVSAVINDIPGLSLIKRDFLSSS